MPEPAVLLIVLIVTSFATVGLWTLAAASLRVHWFWRTLLVLAPLSLLLFVPAYEPFVAYVSAAAVVGGGLAAAGLIARRRRARSAGDPVRPASRVQFSMGSLLGAMLLTCAAVATAVRVPSLSGLEWANIVLIGVSCGGFGLLGTWFIYGRVGWRSGILAVAFALLLIQPLAWTDNYVDDLTGYLEPFQAESGRTQWWLILPAIGLATGCFVLLARWSGWRLTSMTASDIAEPPSRGTQRGSAARWSLRVLLPALLALPAYVLARMLFPDPIPSEPLPSPNGFDDLVEASKMVTDPIFDSWDTAGRDQLQKAIDSLDDRAFAMLRTGLERPARVPISYRDPEGDLLMDEMMAFRSLARVLMAQARVHRFDKNWQAAAERYVDLLRFGHQIEHGGLMISALVGIAITDMGLHGLAEIREGLDADSTRRLAQQPIELDASREIVDAVLERESIWSQHAYGWHGRLTATLNEMCGKPISNSEMFRTAMDRSRTILRLLAVELAISAYGRAHGEPPPTLVALVPGFLPHVPTDPFAGEPLRYRRTDAGFQLYSIGSDGRDDGGQFPSEEHFMSWGDDGDISLDAWLARNNAN